MRDLDALVVDRPFCFVDCETTGTSVTNDRIVELSLVIVHPAMSNTPPFVKTRRLNPGIPIPAEATAVHGITDEDVRSAPAFRDIAANLWQLLDPCDLAGFNVRRFDLPILRAEFRRAGFGLDHTTRRIIDLQFLFHHREPRDLAAAVSFYLGREHVRAHSAEGDTLVLLELLEAQLKRYEDLPCELGALNAACDEFQPFRTEIEAWFGDDLKNPVFQRGKHKDRTLRWVFENEAQYIGWMLGAAENMDPEVKEFIQSFRRRLYEPAPAAPAAQPQQASLGV